MADASDRKSIPYVRAGLLFVALAAIKILLIPSYFSTDFEVHRNWLAITNSLPMERWYHDTNSENATLDYPPFFAFFERLLSFLGCNSLWAGLDMKWNNQTESSYTREPIWCDVVNGVNVQSYALLVFQRLTVILISDVIYFVACVCWVKMNSKTEIKRHIQLALLYFCPGLIMVDNIHFQYNGILFGVLLFSLIALRKERYILCGIIYAILLNMKHLNLYIAPAYFIFLLIDFCFRDRQIVPSVGRLVKLGLGVIIVFGLSFGPLLLSAAHSSTDKVEAMKSEMQQILSRLFPFERGLTHAYWAPNFWAVYNTMDKVLLVLLSKVLKVITVDETQTASLTGGLVGLNQGSHAVLPTITPRITIVLSLLFSFLPSIWMVLSKGKKVDVQTLLKAIIHSAFAFFMFGWHVHEKAILTVLIPFAFLVTLPDVDNIAQWFQLFSFSSIVGSYSLFPLLFQTREIPVKWAILLTFALLLNYVWLSSSTFYKHSKNLYSTFERIFLFGLIVIEFYQTFIHQIIFKDRLPFLPLMIVSFYCSVALIYSWIRAIILSRSSSTKLKEN